MTAFTSAGQFEGLIRPGDTRKFRRLNGGIWTKYPRSQETVSFRALVPRELAKIQAVCRVDNPRFYDRGIALKRDKCISEGWKPELEGASFHPIVAGPELHEGCFLQTRYSLNMA